MRHLQTVQVTYCQLMLVCLPVVLMIKLFACAFQAGKDNDRDRNYGVQFEEKPVKVNNKKSLVVIC